MPYGNFLVKGMGLSGGEGNGTGLRVSRFNAQEFIPGLRTQVRHVFGALLSRIPDDDGRGMIPLHRDGAVQHEVFQHCFSRTGGEVVNAVQTPQRRQRAFSVLHGLGGFFPERDVLQPMNAAFGQVADGKVVVEGFRELAGLRARRGFQLHGQRAAQGKTQDGGGIGFIFRIESQGEPSSESPREVPCRFP